MGPATLAQVLRPLQDVFDENDFPNLLNHLDYASDAALYRIDDERIMIQNVDFFPPMVDDPYLYGAIAAANAMSDVYAMGGEVAMALNVAEFPSSLPADYIAEIIRGGAEKVREAQAIIAGGHTLVDAVPKYGLCVTGFVNRERLLTKAGARPGDVLLLTKSLGTGAILTAEKGRLADAADVSAATKQMATLNRTSAKVLQTMPGHVHAATDITGFSLLGHAWEMAEQSDACLQFDFASLPFLSGSLDYASRGIHCSATARNKAFFGRYAEISRDIDPEYADLLFGSESSGGLLVALSSDKAEMVCRTMADQGQACHVVGHVTVGSGIRVTGNT